MNLLRLSIRQTYASIGIETKQAKLEMESPPGQLEVQSTPSSMQVSTNPGDLEVDSSRAWMALGKGNHLEWLHHISSQMHQAFLLNVSRIVEEGNQLAQFKKSTIADMMVNRIQEKSNVNYLGTASVANVDIHYRPSKTNIEWAPHSVDVQYTPQKVQASYKSGNVEVYLKHKNSLSMWVSDYNIYA
ncbi:hypothetical protein D3C76_75590 [compost metagenome]|nr:DUF6470 family protein [Paenibacillus timonensis]MUG88567.1 hypothetical protein [Paenibacillus timonensis]